MVVEVLVITSSGVFVAGAQGDVVEGAEEEEAPPDPGTKLLSQLKVATMLRRRSKNQPNSHVRCVTRTIAARTAIKFICNRIKRYASLLSSSVIMG